MALGQVARRLSLWPALLALGICAGPARAGNPGASFLKIPVNAQSLGAGAGYAAGAYGAGAVSVNPAGLSGLQGKELTMLYAPHLEGMNLGFLAYGHPTRHGAFGLSYLTLRAGTLEGRDESGNRAADFTAEDRALALSYSRALLRRHDDAWGALRLGATIKRIESRIGAYQASGFAADLGVQAPLEGRGWPMALGVSVRNLGPGISFLEKKDPLPLNVLLGLVVRPAGALMVTGGITRHLAEEKTELSVGTEFAPWGMFSVRGQYALSRSGGGATRTLPMLAGGFGFRYGRYQLDYAFMPMGELGATQRMSLTLRFGSFEPEPVPRKFGSHTRERKGAQKRSHTRADDGGFYVK